VGRACRGDAEGDRLLAALLVAARTDDLATRVVLERVLPGLRSRAVRWRRQCEDDWDAAFGELVSAAWVVIRCFPVERRSRQLAPNLLRDAEHLAFVKATRRAWTSEPVPSWWLDLPVDPPPPEPVDELAALVADARLGAAQRRVVRALLNGRLTADVAAELGVSERTVRYHRDALVARLRAAV
jgi:DNA-binding CsgD family transcriptional regulator